MPATRFFLLLILLAAAGASRGQKGSHVLYLGDGIVSMHQFRGVTHTSKMDLPNSMTGALFLTYRYFFSRSCAVGVAAGIDNQRGALTWGHYNYGGYGGPGGTYVRHTQTIAAEFLVNYVCGRRGCLYGAAGAGYTFARLVKTYDADSYYGLWQNGQMKGPPERQLRINESGFNFQLTTFGYRTPGRAAFFLETGVGYKGIFCLGFSYKP